MMHPSKVRLPCQPLVIAMVLPLRVEELVEGRLAMWTSSLAASTELKMLVRMAPAMVAATAGMVAAGMHTVTLARRVIGLPVDAAGQKPPMMVAAKPAGRAVQMVVALAVVGGPSSAQRPAVRAAEMVLASEPLGDSCCLQWQSAVTRKSAQGKTSAAQRQGAL